MVGITSRTWVFVGLGNPGKKYEMTRHNMGFLVIKALAKEWGLTFTDESRFHAQVAKGTVDGVQVHLLMPTTYMNESGQAIRAYLDFYKLTPSYFVIAVDDIAHPFGEMSMKPKGSSGGHNGLRSIQAHLGTSEYLRLRIGIGDARDKAGTLADYVLDSFTAEEKASLGEVTTKGAQALKRLVNESPDKVMKEVNTKRLLQNEEPNSH